MENVSVILFLLFGITFLAVLSNKYKFPFPIVLVLSGVAISLIPGLPIITLSPEIVFGIFLPPLLYSAAWNTSWHEFKAAIRPIAFAAIALVIFTTVLVAIVAHWIIPDMDWPTAFLIGAIVSPPDAVAATSVTKGLGLSPFLNTILEGESLVNDASGLTLYRYAITTITAGNFVLWQAGLNFLVGTVVGIIIGLAVGFVMVQIHKRFICDPIIEVTLTFLTPFAAYLLAEHFHFSGVLAVVSTGLFISFQSGEIFSYQSRIMAYSVWEVVIFILNGLVFILIGLQLRNVVQGIHDYSVASLLVYGLVISGVVIVVRFIYVIPSALWPTFFLSKSFKTQKLNKGNVVIFAWAGMRGVVSMAAALAIPLVLPASNQTFPHRNLVIYLSFCVILSTLVLLGFTLPWVVKKLKVEPYSIEVEEYDIRTEVVSKAIGYIEENLSMLQGDLLHNIKSKYEVKYNRLQKTDLPVNYFGKGTTLAGNIFNEYSKVQIDLINIERQVVDRLHRGGKSSEEVLRKLERELDLEETRLRMEMYEG